MKQTVNFYSFRDAFGQRVVKNFSSNGLSVLWNYLEEYEQNTGKEMELDVIALCCGYNESSSVDIARDYNVDISDCCEQSEIDSTIREYLEDNTMLCGEYESDDEAVFVFAAF